MEGKKECPFCGNQININAKKCRFCGNWIDEEIVCPFCAEKIKASAKKCRFCGEWLSNEANNISTSEQKKSATSKKQIFVISSIILLILLLCGGLFYIYSYVPPCNSPSINQKLQEHLQLQFPEINSLSINNETIQTISKNPNGYTCKASAFIDGQSSTFEYTYSKINFNNYSFNSKLLLADCYDNGIQNVLKSLLRETNYLSINKIASVIEVENAIIKSYNKDLPSYECSATGIFTAKPGQAFALGWGTYDADTQIKCSLNYKNIFCGNHYTNCVSLKDISNCVYNGGLDE